jgi:hypothetical protein
LNGGQRAQLTDRQFPDQSARHRSHLYKKNFALLKDNKILLILQTGLLCLAVCRQAKRIGNGPEEGA